MNRSIIAIAAALVLAGGLLVGAAAGGLFATAGPTASPGLAVATATIAPATATPAASSSPTGSVEPSPSPTATPLPTPTPAPTPEMAIAPLTGLLVPADRAHRHVVAVMIDDQFKARPQSGLSRASVVWQAPAEGGIPRYMALFQEGSPPSVGPVRSSRLYFIAWASEWNSVYVHAGGSPQALALLRSSQGKGKVVFNADEFRWGGRYLWRIKTRLAPHNVYTDSSHLRSLATKVGAKPINKQPVWVFAPDAALADRPSGGTIVVPYLANKITYKYDRNTNSYPRTVSVEGKQIDKGTKQRIAPKNVVIMVMSFAPLNDGSHKHRLEAQFTGSGVAWISTNGKTIKGTWKKKSMTSPTRFYGPNGQPAVLTAGQTFVQVVPRGTKVTIKAGKAVAPAASPSPSASPQAS